jgi:hypothetical protein
MAKIAVSDPLTPSTANTPLDARQRVESVSDIRNIPLAWVGMLVYVTGEDKYYRVTSLRDRSAGMPNYYPDTWEEFSSGTFSENAVTAYTVSGLEAGTDIGGKTALEVLDMMLCAEFAPRWVDASVAISIGTTIYSVGDNVPGASAFSVSGSPASAIGKTTATGGSGTDTKTVAANTMAEGSASATFGSGIVKRGALTVNISREYAAGSTQVVTTNGNPTNKTANNNTTKISAATVNANIDAQTFIIKAISRTNSVDIYFAYPIYIDGNAQALSYNGTSNSKTKAIAAGGNITFDVPAIYTGVKVEYYDSVTRSWVVITCAVTDVTKTIGSNSLSVAYKRYTYAEVSGSREYRISYTPQS